MKTYQFTMTRTRWMSFLIAIMLIVMLVMLCTPYFTYGKDTLTFVPPEGGNTEHLQGKWVLSGSDNTKDGYKEIEITSAKAMTVSTTNIIRVNQLAADEAVNTAKAAYETVAKSVNEAETSYLTAQAQLEYVKEAVDLAKGKTAPEGVDVSGLQANLDNATAAIATAKANYETAKAFLDKVQAAVDTAKAAAVKAYTANASYAWITETEDAYNAAIAEAFPGKTEEELAAMVGEERDSVIYNKLADEKAIAATAASEAAAAVKETEQIVKDAASAAKAAASALKTSDKELKKARETALAVDAEAKFTEDAIKVEISDIPALKFEDYAKDSKEDAMMVTEGKVSYKENKSTLALTFANGEKMETSYATSIAYNQIKKLSILGYVGFPYTVEDFTTEMSYKLENFYINDVVLVPILLMVLAIIGIIICILKSDKMGAGFIPFVFGLVGVFGYLTSDFLKLGDKYLLHILCYVVITLVSALHIYLSIKDRKKA